MFDRRKPVPGRVERLSSIMRQLGHQRLDVLKIDIEGAEFEAVPDLLDSGIEIVMISVLRQLPRNSRIMSAVRAAAMSPSAATPCTAALTNTD